MSKKKFVTKDEDFNYILIDDAIALLQNWKEKYGKNLRLDTRVRYEYGDTDSVVELTYERPYTKEELQEEEERRVQKESREREQLAKLKAKYEGS
jgi:hypothetical protein